MLDNLAKRSKEICGIYGIKPARSKGQNFLINPGIYQAIIKAADIKKDDTIIEVGPGLGFLTSELAKKAKEVMAVELDDTLAGFLETAVASQDNSNIKVINKDILKFNPDDYLAEGADYRIVANLPYNITSIFLRSFLSSPRPPQSLVLMLQKEVAQRIVASPPKMSLLSLSVQYYGHPEIIRIVPASDFWPSPAVDSAILRFYYEKESPNKDSLKKDRLFFRLARIAFSARRKTLKNNLGSALPLDAEQILEMLNKAGLKEDTRAEQLSLADWQNLFAVISPFML